MVAIARDQAALDAMEGEHRDRVRAIPVDLGDVESLAKVAQAALDAFGEMDGLVNCAGVARYEPVGAIEADSVDAQLRVNLIESNKARHAISLRLT